MLGILPKQELNSICVYTTRTIRNDGEHKYPKKEGTVERMYPHIQTQLYFSEPIGAIARNHRDRTPRDSSNAVILRTGSLRVT